MCRLFGQHAHPGADACEPLCSAHNALRFQSHRHPHGWGIGWYTDDGPHVRRGILPAHADETFVAAGREVRSRVFVAHVREASVGPVHPENTHPFLSGSWLFAHNGTVARFRTDPAVRAAVEAEIDPDLRQRIRGATDSERCFYVFLSRLRAREGLEGASLEGVRRALAETSEVVVRLSHAEPSVNPTSLNLLVTDGRVLAATRWRRSLHVAVDTSPLQVFAVASEPIGDPGRWGEVPEGGFVGTEDGARVIRAPLRS
jgi:predicted glutamine amidotransferase